MIFMKQGALALGETIRLVEYLGSPETYFYNKKWLCSTEVVYVWFWVIWVFIWKMKKLVFYHISCKNQLKMCCKPKGQRKKGTKYFEDEENILMILRWADIP